MRILCIALFTCLALTACKAKKKSNHFYVTIYKLQKAEAEDKRSEVILSEEVSVKDEDLWKATVKKVVMQLKDKQAFEVYSWCASKNANGTGGQLIGSPMFGLSSFAKGYALLDENNNLIQRFPDLKSAQGYILKETTETLDSGIELLISQMKQNKEVWDDEEIFRN